MNAGNVLKYMKSIADTMEKNSDYLVQLDQQNGDGDLGIYMTAGFKAVCGYMETSDERDLGRLFQRSSAVFNEAAPSSLGTILSFAFMGMARSLKGMEDADLSQIADAMENGVNMIMQKANSKPGEKTVLDALCPGIEALKQNVASGAKAAFEAAAKAAAQGSESTKGMKPVHGRAAYYGEKGIGLLDGGSVAGKLIFEAIYAAID